VMSPSASMASNTYSRDSASSRPPLGGLRGGGRAVGGAGRAPRPHAVRVWGVCARMRTLARAVGLVHGSSTTHAQRGGTDGTDTAWGAPAARSPPRPPAPCRRVQEVKGQHVQRQLERLEVQDRARQRAALDLGQGGVRHLVLKVGARVEAEALGARGGRVCARPWGGRGLRLPPRSGRGRSRGQRVSALLGGLPQNRPTAPPSRRTLPGRVRPARPARCVACTRLMGTTSRDSMPLAGW
jgi:hypothetical protein